MRLKIHIKILGLDNFRQPADGADMTIRNNQNAFKKFPIVFTAFKTICNLVFTALAQDIIGYSCCKPICESSRFGNYANAISITETYGMADFSGGTADSQRIAARVYPKGNVISQNFII